MASLHSALSSFGNSALARDLTAAVPTLIALSAAGAGPAASTAASALAAAGTSATISDLGKQLAGLGSSVVGGVENALSGIGNGIAKVVTTAEDAVSSVASPVVYGLGALLNVMA